MHHPHFFWGDLFDYPTSLMSSLNCFGSIFHVGFAHMGEKVVLLFFSLRFTSDTSQFPHNFDTHTSLSLSPSVSLPPVIHMVAGDGGWFSASSFFVYLFLFACFFGQLKQLWKWFCEILACWTPAVFTFFVEADDVSAANFWFWRFDSSRKYHSSGIYFFSILLLLKVEA